MKKWLLISLLGLFLAGCGAQETFETVLDEEIQSVMVQPQQVLIELPEDVSAPAMESENGEKLYFCDGYTISLQTGEAGDLDRTIRELTGLTQEQLQVQKVETETEKRYYAAWSAFGEEGEQVGRFCILDDGQYHYGLSVMASAQESGKLQETWENLFASFRVVNTQDDVNSGS